MAQFLVRITRSPVGTFVDSVLRGVGQVFLQNNPLTGLLFLLGIFLSSYVAGLLAILGTAVSTATAMLTGVSRAAVRKGLYGFNGTLVAVDLTAYVQHDYGLVGYVIFASIAAAILTAAIGNFLNSDHVPTLTAAFVLTTWVFLAGLRQFSRLAGSALLSSPHLPVDVSSPAGDVTPSDLLYGFFNGFSEVLLQSGLWTGVVFLIGILLNSRISAAAAGAASLVGFAIGWGLGVPVTALHGGTLGYNAVLTAIALAGVYYLFTSVSAVFAAVAAAASVVVYAMLTTILSPLGLPVVTAPFVATTWTCVFAASSLTRLRAIHPSDAGTPEANLHTTGRRWDSLTPWLADAAETADPEPGHRPEPSRQGKES